MEDKMSVLEELGRTSKGRLRYCNGPGDAGWLGRLVVRIDDVDQVLSALETELQNERNGEANSQQGLSSPNTSPQRGSQLTGPSGSTSVKTTQEDMRPKNITPPPSGSQPTGSSPTTTSSRTPQNNMRPNVTPPPRDSMENGENNVVRAHMRPKTTPARVSDSIKNGGNNIRAHISPKMTPPRVSDSMENGGNNVNVRAQLQKTVCLYEQERQETVRETVGKQRVQVEQQIAGLWQQVQQQLSILQDQHRLDSRRQQDKVNNLLLHHGERSQQRIQQLEEDHRQRARHLDAQLQEAIVRQTQQQRRKQAYALEKLRQLIKQQEESNAAAQAMTTLLTNFGQKDALPADVLNDAHRAVTLTSNLTRQVSAASEAGGTTDQVLQLAQTTLAEVKAIQARVVQAVEKAREEARKAEEEKARQEQERARAQAAEQEKQAAQKQAEKAAAEKAVATKTASSAKSAADAKEAFLTTYTQTIKRYRELQTNLDNCVQSYQPLAKSTDSQLKKYAFDLQKAVNTPLNAISSHSASHVTDKLKRLCKLLQGQQVEVSDKRISTASHPLALPFCKELLARKFMKQGVEQIASNHESAFPIAAVAVGVWMEFPDVGDLLLAQFHRACPYIVPFYPPRMDGQTDEDFYKSKGYVYKDGTVEKQDKFLKRMSGIMRLYAAIVQTDTGSRRHPHGAAHGWCWLSSVINLDPETDVTATLLYDFLQVAGHALMKAYGKQFHKLLHILCRDYFTQIQAVTGAGQGGPVSRLKGLLEECIKTQRIPAPKGMLTSVFWTS
ncbi:PREDICTED: nucleoporin GLE1-like [Branchiostoma belcheri]|uniref:mRNA export factor GLE1 n=1 Tax=Branchiostoma belcheri TaxID=7741 RepID=A0A6P4XWK5_BRABE|nr:PREDICTED: nucleoporin GLE1-like [Branchiostoma belcheri]